MSIKEDRQDFADYLQKVKEKPDPEIGDAVWKDDPYMRGENYKRVKPLKDRKKALKKKRKR
jgi:hypothetical protein